MKRIQSDTAQVKRLAGFRRRLKARMDQLDLTQTELARAIGRTQGTVSDYFNKVEAIPDGEAMMSLPTALKCSGHWLLTGDGPMAPPDRAAKEADIRAYGAQEAINRMRESLEVVARDIGNGRRQ